MDRKGHTHPCMSPRIQFCGAARTVTGSRHVIRYEGKTVLVDCGLFQGSQELKQRNWSPFPASPEEIDAVVLTHAHQDHIGYLPKLVREGYRGPIYATRATLDLCRISLPDGGRHRCCYWTMPSFLQPSR